MKSKLGWIVILSVFLSGCAVSTSNTVVTMPPLTTNSKSSTETNAALPTSVAVLPFKNNTESVFAYTVVRQTMVNHFASKNYRMMHWQDVDRRLSLAGIDETSELSTLPTQQLKDALGVDGLIFGNITHYDKTFAGIYSQVAVGVELNFINQNNETIWEVKDVRRSHAGGISTTPVGLILNALISANHIVGDLNLYRAADDLGRDLAEDMPHPENLNQARKPIITDLVHSGVGQYLRYGDILEIGLTGESGMTAAASIEGIGMIDLTESSPGEYHGKLVIDKKHNIDNVVVTARLQNDMSQTSSWNSPYGLLNIDNTAPMKVGNLTFKSSDSAVNLNWDAADDDVIAYQVGIATSETGEVGKTFSSNNSEYEVGGLTNFQRYFIEVSAIDRAGNQGSATRIAVIPGEDNRLNTAVSIHSEIPPVISGVQKLTKLNSPYLLLASTRVATDGVLFIEPGVHISVAPQGKITILGELQVLGTQDAPVTVAAQNDQNYDAFLVLQSNKSVNINGLVVKGAGIPIEILAGKPLIQSSEFVDNAFSGIVISGSAKPTIRQSTISGSKASGVVVSGQAQPIFKDNSFKDNEPFQMQNVTTYSIDATGNNWSPDAAPMLLGDIEI